MVKKCIILFFIIISFQTNYCQGLPGVDMSQADIFREEGNIKDAIREFKKIYEAEPENRINIYNYACALSIDKQIDSSFKYLKIANNILPKENALTDPDFISLKQGRKWIDFENDLIKKLRLDSKLKNIEYAKKLWKMKSFDQAYYDEIHLAENKIGKESSVVTALWDLKTNINKNNQKDFQALIEKFGWPKISDVGNNASSAAFLIIQHSDLSLQEKYLNEIQKLCLVNEASWQEYALMYDRIQISKNKKQRYGSQIKFNTQTNKFEMFPLEDESKVIQWRNEIGLQPLDEYLSRWNIKFEPKK